MVYLNKRSEGKIEAKEMEEKNGKKTAEKTVQPNPKHLGEV